MLIFPAIDLYERKAVRLFKGDYSQMTVYSEDPLSVAKDFSDAGATWLHTVDLEGARSGNTPNLELIRQLANESGLFTEVGGGIRSMDVIERYINSGVKRVILGTAAVSDPNFAREAYKEFGSAVAIGIDIKDGYVAIKGWTEKSVLPAFDFCKSMQDIGISTVICTDISRDGAMRGSNLQLYREMSERFSMNIIASGGVSSMQDITALRGMDLYGAIVGKAYYTKAIDLREAIEAAK